MRRHPRLEVVMPDPDGLAKTVRVIATRAGLPVVGMHAMRHADATWLLRAGVDIRTVSSVLRHASPSITLDVYAHEVKGAQAAAVTELDRILVANHPAKQKDDRTPRQ